MSFFPNFKRQKDAPLSIDDALHIDKSISEYEDNIFIRRALSIVIPLAILALVLLTK
jgi:hypothetical protein